MSRKREKSDSRYLDDLVDSYYKKLRDETVRIRRSGKYFFCPYCEDLERDYELSELDRHASRIAKDSKSASLRDKAKHLGLLRYLGRYMHTHRIEQPYIPSKRHRESVKNDSQDHRSIHTASVTMDHEDAEPGEIVADEYTTTKLVDLGTQPGTCIADSTTSGVSARTSPIKRSSSGKGDDELLVWPWMVIVANLPVELKNGKHFGESGKKLREQWASEGYNPTKVHPLWDHRGHSGFAIVEFKKDWQGYKSAMDFEKSFVLDNRGKRDWRRMARHKCDKLYGWLAGRDEYYAGGLIGKHLQKNGDLKSVSDIEKEDIRKDSKLLCNLNNILEIKNKKCEEITEKISKTEVNMRNVVLQQEEMTQRYNEEIKQMQVKASDQLRKISEEHERSRVNLEAKKQDLKLRERELLQREALNEREQRKLDTQKQMNEMAIIEQRKADERMLKLAEDQKRQKENLHKQILELEKKLDQKQALELEIQRMKGAVEVMRHMGDEGDMEDKKKLESVEKELREKEEEFYDVQSLGEALIIKERNANDELQDARKELIHKLSGSRAYIRVKRMGDLDGKPFLAALKSKYASEEAAIVEAMEKTSLWDDHLRDPSWHPYKVVKVNEGHQEIIDENDEKLRELKSELGEDVYKAVVQALNELNEYNASGRYPVPDLWNARENRKASLTEGIEYILKQWKLLKSNRRRN